MAVYVELRPFTVFRGADLGLQLHQLVTRPANRELIADFPSIRTNYWYKEVAIQNVRLRQHDMRTDPKYAALVVMLGKNPDSARVSGVVTAHVHRLPGMTLARGTLVAMWLDAAREPALRHVGPEVLGQTIEWVLARKAFVGPLWSVVRVDNSASRRMVERGTYPLKFRTVGRPAPYQQVDGMRVRRQQYRSTETLQEIRARRR